MGFSITVSRCDVDNCPHCGKPIRGTIRDYEYSGGRVWKDYLEKIGYYVPYEIREKEPERDFYGKDMTLTSEQAKDHPVKTRQSEFLKKFPNAVIDEDDGILGIRPCDIDERIGCTNEKGCDGCRRKYWLAEVHDND